MTKEHKYFVPAPKPAPSKKKGKGSGGKKGKKPAKTVDMEAVENKITERNNRNRNFGKAVEKAVAKLTGGERVPMSGAIKQGNFGLVGDVRVTHRGAVIALIECKGTSRVAADGDKTFTLKLGVLQQIDGEAESLRTVPALWVHYLHASYETDYVVLRWEDYAMQMLGDTPPLSQPTVAFSGAEGIVPRGGKSYTLRKSVLDAYQHQAGERSYAAVHLTWGDANYVILPARAYLELLDSLRVDRDREVGHVAP